jgi:hypothetical protein
MIHKPGKVTIDPHLVELRRKGIEALHCFRGIAERLDFYEKYLALSKYYDVRLAGPFLVIKGGKPAGRTDKEKDRSITNLYGVDIGEQCNSRSRS